MTPRFIRPRQRWLLLEILGKEDGRQLRLHPRVEHRVGCGGHPFEAHLPGDGFKKRQEMEGMRQMIKLDPHSPKQFRCNGPLGNLPEFQQAFDVPAGAPMVRPADTRVQIW